MLGRYHHLSLFNIDFRICFFFIIIHQTEFLSHSFLGDVDRFCHPKTLLEQVAKVLISEMGSNQRSISSNTSASDRISRRLLAVRKRDLVLVCFMQNLRGWDRMKPQTNSPEKPRKSWSVWHGNVKTFKGLTSCGCGDQVCPSRWDSCWKHTLDD